MNDKGITEVHAHSSPDGSHSQRRVTVNCLPLDVLVIILREVYQAVRRPVISRIRPTQWDALRLHSWPLTDSHDVADLAIEHVGVECLAVVHPLWREAMSLNSAFWACPVIWIGRDPTPFSNVREYLAWSQDDLLDVYVLRRYDPSVYDSMEKAQVAAIFELLAPHLHRCRVLYVNTLHPSSLPRPRIELVGDARKLLELHLRSILDTSLPADFSFLPYGRFITPMLEVLSMNGAHFRDSYVKPFPQFKPPRELLYLALIDYDSRDEPLSVRDLLWCIVSCKNISSAHFENLQLENCYPSLPFHERDSRIWWNPDLEWVGMDAEVIVEHSRLLAFPTADSVTYRRCTAIPCYIAPPRASEIYFEEIDDPDVLLSYLALSPDIVPVSINITRCDGLSSAVFRALAMPFENFEEVDETWKCPNLSHILIKQCTNFGSQDLLRFVEARDLIHEATNWADEFDPHFVVSSLTNVTVVDGPELDPDDGVRFKELCSTVSWNGSQVDQIP